jgi:hypothetical protein
MLRQRQRQASPTKGSNKHSTTGSSAMDGPDDPRQPLLRGSASLSGRPSSASSPPPQPSSPAVQEEVAGMDMQNMSRRSQWILLAVGSGACAAFNGVFAKLYVYVDPFL